MARRTRARQRASAGPQDGPVRGGRGEQHGRAELRYCVRELRWRRPLQQEGGRPDPHREDQQAAEAKGEGQRWCPGEHVGGFPLDEVFPEGVGDGEHITVEVHRRLRRAGGAGRRGQEGHIVRCGCHVAEGHRLGRAPPDQITIAGAAIGHQRKIWRGVSQFRREPVVTNQQCGAGQVYQGSELGSAQHGHGGHHHAAGLQCPEPASHEPRVVGPAEQQALPGKHAEVLGENAGHLVGPVQQVAIGPGLTGGEQARLVTSVGGHHVIEQCRGAVHLLRILELGQLEADYRPLLLGRQVVAAECVGIRGRRELHGGSPLRRAI